MEYRRVGKSGLRVSAVSIGGWLTVGASLDDTTSHDILREALDHGVNFIDVADIYARGECEKVVGRFLQDVRRSSIVLSSKVFWPMSDDVNDRGLSRKHIMESIERSLRRLQTDYLDIYFCHRADPETPLEETVRAMDDLVRQGKILYWGTSVWDADLLQRTHELCDRRGYARPIVEQPRYNLVDRRVEQAVLPTCARTGTGLVVWSPLAQGLLTGKYNDRVPEDSRAATSDWLAEHMTEENLDRVRKLDVLATETGLTPGQLALAWLLEHETVASVITGASRPEQVRENVKAADVSLDSQLYEQVDELFSAE